MPHTIQFDRDAVDDLRRLRKRDQTTILSQVQRYLVHQPTQEQGARSKALEQPAASQFRLRIGEFRVYYDVDEEDQRVDVLRVMKKGTRTTQEVTGHEDD